MKNLYHMYICAIITIMLYPPLYSIENIITLFIKKDSSHLQDSSNHSLPDLISEKLAQPSFIIGNNEPEIQLNDGIRGISGAYLGYFATSNQNGQISFPKKQQSDTIYLLITPEITPIFMIYPTLIHHWNINPAQPHAMYEITRKRNKKINTYYFDVINIQEAINNKETKAAQREIYQNILNGKTGIPLNTIILFTDPKNISVPLGISQNFYSPNFILPTIYAQDTDMTKNSLYTLTIKQYLEQVHIHSKNEAHNLATIITNE